MPTLKLTKLPKEIQLLNITAIMCFPSDKNEDQRRYWSLKHWVGIAADKFVHIGEQDGYSEDLSKQIGSWLGDVIHHVGSWPALANAVIGPRQKNPAAAEAKFYMKKYGIVIGYILKDILAVGGGVSTASRRYVSDENRQILKKDGIKPPIKTPEYIHEKIWNGRNYKNVAHLWAAFLDGCLKPRKPHRYLPIDQFHMDGLADSEPQGLEGFIRLSEIYREAGINYFPPKSKKTLLDKDKAWKIVI